MFFYLSIFFFGFDSISFTRFFFVAVVSLSWAGCLCGLRVSFVFCFLFYFFSSEFVDSAQDGRGRIGFLRASNEVNEVSLGCTGFVLVMVGDR